MNSRKKTVISHLLLSILTLHLSTRVATTQRSQLHWKHDLEYRLGSYFGQRQALDSILASSIYREPITYGPTKPLFGANVRFNDLLIPDGALVLDSQMAKPTVKIIVNKTQSYVISKMNELYQINTQVNTIQKQFNQPNQKFIYKGAPNIPLLNHSRIGGTRIFKQFIYGHVIKSDLVDLRYINGTNVDKVLNDTYLDVPDLGVRDSQSRLFFEGKKTFWRTVFERSIRSGCCDRMKPLHTNRMMLRSKQQNITAPLMFHTNDHYNREPVVIESLITSQIYNQHLAVGLISNRPEDIGLVQSLPQNLIQIGNLISTLPAIHPQIVIQKGLVFRDLLIVDDAQVMKNRLVFNLATVPGLHLDLSLNNRLLRHSAKDQLISGTTVVNSEAHFLTGLDGAIINRIRRIDRFFAERLVRIDRSLQIIKGSVQFHAIPAIFQSTKTNGAARTVAMISINGKLNVNLINGMNIPADLVVLPRPQNLDIIVRGTRQFIYPVLMRNHVLAKKHVCGLSIPDEVIPLHLNDLIGSTSTSTLTFVDGIIAKHITIESGHFDDIALRDVQGGAQHVLMNSIIVMQPDRSHLIRAPLRISKLRFLTSALDQGLLNGFRPQNIVELAQQKTDIINGYKIFSAYVEAVDCIINDINNLPNWTNHLVRIDRPNTIQTINNKLAFVQPPLPKKNSTNMMLRQPIDYGISIQINRFDIEYLPNNNPNHYHNNLIISPEFYSIHLALLGGLTNYTNGRYRVLDIVQLMDSMRGRVNGVILSDILTLDTPFKFSDRFVMVGKVTVLSNLDADRILSNYPVDAMDLTQFYKYRIPILGAQTPVHLNSLILSTSNRVSFIQSQMVNGISISDFVSSIMSLTRPQVIDTRLIFSAPINLGGLVRTGSLVNGLTNFREFAKMLKSAEYIFEDGLQCNVVIVRN